MNKITISFKSTKKEQKMYNHIKEQEEISDFIKQAVDYYMRYVEIIEDEK